MLNLKFQLQFRINHAPVAVSRLLIILVAGALFLPPSEAVAVNIASNTSTTAPIVRSIPGADSVELSESQMSAVRISTIAVREFVVEKQAVGSIDFDEDRTVQVFTPYQGRIIAAFSSLGDPVKKGDVLFTIESPDFISAQSNLISTAATLDQASSALARAKALYVSRAIDLNDYETAVANQKSADGAFRAARNAVAIFGRTESQIDRIVETHRVERALVVKSPITGTVTARNAAPGLLEQPGNAPAPYIVSDLSTIWMVANVPEADSPEFKRGQSVSVSVPAYPARVFQGKITAVGAIVDPNSRRVMVRSEIKDPQHALRPQMFATFLIHTREPIRALAIPLNGVVREGDGTMSVWVAGNDTHKFTRRVVTIGMQQGGYREIRGGLQAGEVVAVDGAIFLSNMLYGGAS